MLEMILTDSWVVEYLAAGEVVYRALASMVASSDRSVRGSAVRRDLARAIRAERNVDRRHGARWAGVRYLPCQSGRELFRPAAV